MSQTTDRSDSTPRPRRFTTAGSRAVDRTLIEDWGLPGLVLMEHAARSVVEAIEPDLESGGGSEVLVFAGPGNNGGDGWAVARHLVTRRDAGLGGGRPLVVSVGEPRAGTDAHVQARVARRMGIPEVPLEAIADRPGPPPTLVLDCLLGTGVVRPAEGAIAAAIALVATLRSAGATVVAVDVPSGLDADTGLPVSGGPAIAADRTVSFLGPKVGYSNPPAARWTGRVVTGDIGAPPEVLDAHAFDESAGSTGDA